MTGARARPVMTGKMSFCRLRRQEPFWSSQSDGQDSSWRFDVGWTTAGLGPRSSSPVPRWLHDCCRRRPQRRRQDHVDRTALRSGSYRRGKYRCPGGRWSRPARVPQGSCRVLGSAQQCTVGTGAANRRGIRGRRLRQRPVQTPLSLDSLAHRPRAPQRLDNRTRSQPAFLRHGPTWARRPDPGDHSRPGYAHPPPRRGQQPTAAQLRSPRPARGDARRVVPRNRTA